MDDEVDNRYFELSMKLGCCLIVGISVLLFLCSVVFCVVKIKDGITSHRCFIYLGMRSHSNLVSRFDVEKSSEHSKSKGVVIRSCN